MYFAYYINWSIRLFFVNWSNIHTQRIVGLLILFRCVGAYKIFVAPTFVCIHFVVHYWQSLVLFSSFSGPNPPHQWSSETFIITLLLKVWSRHAGQRNPLTTWNIKNYNWYKYEEMDIFQLMIAKNAWMKKSVFAYLRHKVHSDRSIQSTQLLISNNSLLMYLSYISFNSWSRYF